MRFVQFVDRGRVRPGFIRDNAVCAITCQSLQEYIALSAAERLATHSTESFSLDGLVFAPPVVPRKNVFCVGRNYLEHAKEGARAAGRELKLPDVPTFFTKAPTSIAAHEQTLDFSGALSKEYDWEAELAVVIGSTVKDVSESEALGAVFGYTCLNDITARDLQRSHVQWFKGKSLDNACPIGPWIVSADSIGDPAHLRIALALNGEVKQSSNTGRMIFGIPRLIAELSKGMTLQPGDVIATGTPDGVGFARTPAEFFKDGDTVEVQIENIGTLRNRIHLR